MKTKGTVWILGASSGLGLATAKAFAENGWLVVAGARSFQRTQNAGAVQGTDSKEFTVTAKIGESFENGENVRLLPLDATDEGSCERFAREAFAISERVDVVCYAAGLLVLGSCEETSADEYERVMRTNFFGMVRMVGKALPVMRRQGNGRLVLFSSLNGLVGVPFQSAYTASKHAIEGYAQCLAMEVKPCGIQVCVVEPGDHQGGSQQYRLNAEDAQKGSPYGKEYASACRTIHHDEANGLLPNKLGQKVVRNVQRKKMRFRLRVAKLDQRAAVWVHALLWPGLFTSIMRAYYVKKG